MKVKKLIILIPLFFISFMVNADPRDMRDGKHVFNYSLSISRCDDQGVLLGPAITQIAMPDYEFTVFKVLASGDFIIQFIQWTNSSPLNAIFWGTGPAPAHRYYFLLSSGNYNLNATRLEPRGRFTVAASTTLIKIKPGRKEPLNGYPIYFDLSNDFNVGVMAGWKVKPYRKLDLSLSFVAGVGYTSLTVNSENTQGIVKSQTNNSALTPSIGFILEYDKFQVGLVSGIDFLAGEPGRSYIYKNRPWIGIGFGYSIFRSPSGNQ